jgi:Methyltransferase FkbM domain
LRVVVQQLKDFQSLLMDKSPISFFIDLLGQDVVRILDLGAQNDGEPLLYKRLLDSLPCSSSVKATFATAYLGNGTAQTLHLCAQSTASSLYLPNNTECLKYDGLSSALRLTEKVRVDTTTLDALFPDRDFDFIKSDMQGADLEVLNFGARVLASGSVVIVETEFIEQYTGGPSFCDVRCFMENSGFLFHSFHDYGTRPLEGFDPARSTIKRGYRQWLWANAVFVKSIDSWAQISDARLLKHAAICHFQVQAYDYSWKILDVLDVRNQTDHASEYLRLLS